MKHMSPSVLTQLEEFFISYNKLRGKKFKVTGRGGPKRALDVINEGIKTYARKEK
jgi:inorganic pyrophosphatase